MPNRYDKADALRADANRLWTEADEARVQADDADGIADDARADAKAAEEVAMNARADAEAAEEVAMNADSVAEEAEDAAADAARLEGAAKAAEGAAADAAKSDTEFAYEVTLAGATVWADIARATHRMPSYPGKATAFKTAYDSKLAEAENYLDHLADLAEAQAEKIKAAEVAAAAADPGNNVTCANCGTQYDDTLINACPCCGVSPSMGLNRWES